MADQAADKLVRFNIGKTAEYEERARSCEGAITARAIANPLAIALDDEGTIMCERAIMSHSWGGMLRGTTKNYGGIGPWMPVVPGLPKKEKTPAAPAYL